MPPSLALLIWFIFLVALLSFDPAKDAGVSSAVWVPLIWISIMGSRLPSQWLGVQVGTAAQALEDGNALDRTIFLFLIVLAIGILNSRSFKWGNFFAHNIALTAFLCFGLVSVVWSDFPFVSFKKWFRDLGNYLVILVVLFDSRPLEALRTLVRRLCYLLIPLSIVLIKYYPQIGRGYDEWTGAPVYSGVETSKYMLGTICLVSGIFFFWDTVTRWSDRTERRTKSIIVVNVAFIAMTLWLLYMANAATCRVCLVLGCMVVAAAHTRAVRRRPGPLKFLIPLGVCLSLFLVFGIDIKASIASAVGRDPTFTDRTLLWSYLVKANTSPVVGTGYESFWLGPRLEDSWANFAFQPNQAHNGYLEVYLNLGLIGLFLVVLFLIASYRTICKRLDSHSSQASLFLALWTILPIYNITTSDFGKGELMWLTFLLGAIAVPARAEGPERVWTHSKVQLPPNDSQAWRRNAGFHS
jgi:exopolysaccharide production protein ExoQ